LHAKGASPLTFSSVGDQHLPPVLDEFVMHEPGAVHRLDHAAYRLVIDGDSASEPVHAVAIGRRREMIDQLTLIGDQTDIDPSATEIQPDV
jgi:hypothetical protein